MKITDVKIFKNNKSISFTAGIDYNTLFKSIFIQSGHSPKILIVTAHPDDDATFAGTNYKIVHDLKGTIDLALITNGEGGYKYSTLAEDIYGLNLRMKQSGKYLPE